MITIKKKYIYLMLSVSIICMFIFGIFGYYTIRDSAKLTENLIKFNSEQFIYFAILFSLTLILIQLLIRKKSTNVEKLLDRAIQVTKFGGRDLNNIFKQLGYIGERMNALYEDLERVNRMKTSKIYSLTYLNTFLSDNIQMNLIVTDVFGKIKYISKKCIEENKINKSDALERNAGDIIEGVNIKARAAEMIKTKRVSIKNIEANDAGINGEKVKPEEIYFYPIFDDNGTLSYIIIVFEDSGQTKILAEIQEPIKPGESRKSYAERFKFWKMIRNK